MKYAQILNAKAHWIFNSATVPDFAPNIVLVEITNANPMPSEGWSYDGATFSPPIPPAPSPIPPAAFLDLFTAAEFEALIQLERTNAKAAAFLRRLQFQASVSSADLRIVAAMNALVTAGILTSLRRDAILGSFG